MDEENNQASKVKVRNVTKIFGKNPKMALKMLEEGKTKKEILKQTGMTVGVNQASFDIQAGEIFVIMGLSGSGKSTLVRLFNRLIEPTIGHVYIDDIDIVKMNSKELKGVRRNKLSMVFQRFALFPHRSVLENTAYGLEVQGVTKAERLEKAKQSLLLVGLGGYEESYPDQLSGGMQQRVGLARALANDPDILLMDEAFSALDPLIRKDMQDELLELQQKMEKTIIFITHDLDEALRIGDRIALMKDGDIVQIGTPEEILMDPANEYVERFVEDVDLSKVLTASNVMKRAETVGIDKGPRVALQLMKDSGISTLYVVNKKRELLGVVNAQSASNALLVHKTLEDILIRDVAKVTGDTKLTDLFEITSNSKVPVAVVDDMNRLQGIIIQGTILGALSGNKDIIHEAGGE
jgi:glycine betaine/proline transport system ATP-binding protein